MIQHPVAENVVPRFGKEPEASRHMGADRGALRTWGTLALAALHLGAHPGVHLIDGNVTDPLFGHKSFLHSCVSILRLGCRASVEPVRDPVLSRSRRPSCIR